MWGRDPHGCKKKSLQSDDPYYAIWSTEYEYEYARIQIEGLVIQ